MIRVLFLLLASAVLAIFAASSSAMVGGHVNPPGLSRYPTTVNINGSCTGVKIGSRSFLTAAHCVLNHALKVVEPMYQPGAPINITNDPSAQIASFTTLEIETTYPDPHYLSGCTMLPCDIMAMRRSGADVALIVVKKPTENIPIARVHYQRIAQGTPIVLTGYGMEDYSNPVRVPSDPVTYPLGRLSYFNSVAYDSSLPAGHGYPSMGSDFFYTMGRAADPSHAGMAPGDSGGPVYLDDISGDLVVGINMAYFTLSGPLAISGEIFSGHSGLQTVGFWMASLVR